MRQVQRGAGFMFTFTALSLFFIPQPWEMSRVGAFVVNKIVKIRINGDNCKHGAHLGSQRGFYKVIK